MTVEVCTHQGPKSTVVTKFTIDLLSLSDYLFQKIFFPSKDKREQIIYCCMTIKMSIIVLKDFFSANYR